MPAYKPSDESLLLGANQYSTRAINDTATSTTPITFLFMPVSFSYFEERNHRKSPIKMAA
jgi:hypothetical protein